MNTSFLGGNAIHKFLGAMVVAILIVGAYISVPHLFTTKKVESAASENVTRWAFAEGGGSSKDGVGIGWISFNNTTDGTLIPYGVNVNEADREAWGIGIFSGHAYSENVGYISFDIANTGRSPAGKGADYSTSPSGAHLAHVAWVKAGGGGGEVTGWARALSVCNFTGGIFNDCDCSLGGSNPRPGGVCAVGGWDGWIKLSNGDDNAPATPHAWQTAPTTSGVKITANKFSGYAWGDAVMGWINFTPDITTTPGPDDVCPIITASGGGGCTPADPTFTAGPCVPQTVCSAANVGDPISGFTSGTCVIGGAMVNSPPVSCSTGSSCPSTCGDAAGVCDSPYENSTTCAADCPVGGPPTCASLGIISTDPSCRVGDLKCSNGENPKNSTDCKARWWQF